MGLVQQSRLVITDSGGLQKEAYFANKRALVIMPDTGWRELVLYKYNVLVNELTLFSTYINLRKIQIKSNLYGLGNTSSRIVNLLHRF
jgi:UDP-GlcNAc3NAcA epimerase